MIYAMIAINTDAVPSIDMIILVYVMIAMK